MSVFRKIGFFTAFIIPILVVVGYQMDGWYNYLTLAFVFVIIPVIDMLSGVDTLNVEASRAKIVAEEFYYRFITYLWTWFQ